MSGVINLSTFKNRQASLRIEKIQGGDLTELLKTATDLRNCIEKFKKTIEVMDFKGLKRVFETRLANIILETKKIELDLFLCSSYIAALLVEIGSSVPESWFAVDYFIKAEAENKPEALKQGANVCFLIYAVFPPRGQIRCMKLEDYKALGQAMYYGYYGQTGTLVAYFMSQQFKPMAEITRECLRGFK